MGCVTHDQAKAFYDRLGARQDSQAFYEDAAIESLCVHSALAAAKRVYEFGCGTGRLAARLLAADLPEDATYLGSDISETMVALATQRLAPFGERAQVVRSTGFPDAVMQGPAFDRVLSTYVLDLLSDREIAATIDAARSALAVDGLFCNASLTYGIGPVSRALSGVWTRIHRWRPLLLGGCRPIRLRPFLDTSEWQVVYNTVLCRYGICSEVTIARRRA